ncbi:spore coat U domain-containing protein [Neisseria sp.]|uniref:Csu type fimbrial protein n=1 Tax=Neisseria sp. TaxID=192066 RepID=UPI0035A00A63
MKKLFVLSSVAAALMASGSAFATETKTADFHVTIKIKPACEFNFDTTGALDAEAMTGGLANTLDWNNGKRADIDFGEHFSNGTTDIDAQSNGAGSKQGIVISCTKGTPYKIGLSPETDNNTAGKGAMNAQAGGAVGKIAYQLYQDAGRGTVWGDQPTNMKDGTGLGFGTPEVLPVYGRVLRADVRDMAAGRYSDKVTVKVEY